MKTIITGVMVTIAVAVSGCTGLEVGGKAWIARIDERQESQRTYKENAVPLKCYFVDCTHNDVDFQNAK